ncbi:MAG: methionine gamma-lyase family protein [Lachnospiraceae bacterium]|nr:methionine gamma-lyase family protein [Lachnospiraceae bacterium]
MIDRAGMYAAFGIDSAVLSLGDGVLESLQERFRQIDERAEFNSLKVIRAMQEARVSEGCLQGSTGYGYGDTGRDTLEAVYAKVFGTEDALVRPQIVSGTHALNVAMSGNLRPGDTLLSLTGKPYDTLESVIGIRPAAGSLAEYGVAYLQADLKPDGSFDREAVERILEEDREKKIRMAAIQKSRGYQTRPTFSVNEIGEMIACVKALRPDIICMVDNCYGEFVERTEPSEHGADLIVGSLIKNPGGGLAPSGGYIAGKKEYVEQAAHRLTSPGLGKEVGASLQVLPSYYQGLFLAPTVTASALKGAVFAATLYEALRERSGMKVLAYPSADAERYDIIQALTFYQPAAVQAFCEGIQAAAPVDSFVKPEPWEMPGYDSKVIMAAGTFIGGSSIELSADGPMREPYSVFFQGGLTFPHATLGILKTVQTLSEYGIFDPKSIQ